MASSSFEQTFEVRDTETSKRVRRDLDNAEPIVVRDENADQQKQSALESIKRWVSSESD